MLLQVQRIRISVQLNGLLDGNVTPNICINLHLHVHVRAICVHVCVLLALCPCINKQVMFLHVCMHIRSAFL